MKQVIHFLINPFNNLPPMFDYTLNLYGIWWLELPDPWIASSHLCFSTLTELKGGSTMRHCGYGQVTGFRWSMQVFLMGSLQWGRGLGSLRGSTEKVLTCAHPVVGPRWLWRRSWLQLRTWTFSCAASLSQHYLRSSSVSSCCTSMRPSTSWTLSPAGSTPRSG